MKSFFLFLFLALNAQAAGKIINADIAPSGTANIALNKLAASTAHNACTFDASGYIAGGVAPEASGNIFKSNGTDWISSTEADPNAWLLTGNAGTTAGTNFLGTTDAIDVVFKTNSSEKMRIKNSNGYLGVNETSPQSVVHATGSGASVPVLTVQNTSSVTHGRYDMTIDNSGFLAFVQNGAGFYLLSFGNSGDQIGVGQYGGCATTTFCIYASAEDHIPLVLKGFGSGTQNLQQWRLSDDTVVARVDSAGKFTVANLLDNGLTASQAVVTDGSKNLASLAYTSANTATTLVERDGSGNFSAGTITASLTGTASGNTTISGQTNHGLVVASATNAMTSTGAGISGQLLQSAGAAADPAYTTATFPSTATQYDLLYASASNVWSSLAKANTSALVTSSTGVPSWASGGTANRLLRTDGTTVSFAQAALTTDVTGTLPVGNGGTGQTTLTSHGVLVGAGASAITQLAAAAAGTVLAGQGSSSDPAFTATPTLGVAGATKGTLAFAGNTSGTVTMQPAAAAGTWTWTLPTDDGNSGESLVTDGAGVTSWQAKGITSTVWTSDNSAITPTNFGTISNATFFTKRIGDTLCVKGFFTTGTVSSSAGSFTIGNSLTIDLTKATSTANFMGWGFTVSGTNAPITSANRSAVIFTDGSTNTSVYITTSVNGGAFQKQAANGWAFDNTNMPIDFCVPISGWTQTN